MASDSLGRWNQTTIDVEESRRPQDRQKSKILFRIVNQMRWAESESMKTESTKQTALQKTFYTNTQQSTAASKWTAEIRTIQLISILRLLELNAIHALETWLPANGCSKHCERNGRAGGISRRSDWGLVRRNLRLDGHRGRVMHAGFFCWEDLGSYDLWTQ